MHVLESVAERALDIYCTSCMPCHVYTACAEQKHHMPEKEEFNLPPYAYRIS